MIFNMNSGEAKKCPVLNSAYPQDASVFIGSSATFTVEIAEEGKPNAYTYQWYVNGSAVSGATLPTYTRENPDVGSCTIFCEVTNKAGTVTSRMATLTVKSYLPAFTYTGSYTFVNDSGGAVTDSTQNWKIRLLTSGTLKFTDLNGAANGIDVFLVGGGGGGMDGNNGYGRSGGGGGYTNTVEAVKVDAGTNYAIVVGAGGSGNGGNSSAFGFTANGGKKGNGNTGGAGGSGGGGGAYSSGTSTGAGGSNGGNGASGSHGSGGTGQGNTTGEFGYSTAQRYSGGGGSGNSGNAGGSYGGSGTGTGDSGTGKSASANTGGGGGGGSVAGGSGGSGIVIIRNKR